MVGCHYWLDGHEFEQDPGVGNAQGGLACCSPWGCKVSEKTVTELNWLHSHAFCSPVLNLCLTIFPMQEKNAMWSYYEIKIRHQGFLKIVLNKTGCSWQKWFLPWNKYAVLLYLVAQLCPTLCDSMNCCPPSSYFMGFSRQENWSGLPRSSPGNLPHPGIEHRSLTLQVDSFTIWATRKALIQI